MHNLQITETQKKAKRVLRQLRFRTKIFIDGRMLKTLTSPLRSSINFIQHFRSFILSI